MNYLRSTSFHGLRTVLLAALLLTALASIALAQVPRNLSFQGVVRDPSGHWINGPASMVFALYDVPANGTALWLEPQTVMVDNGIFNVILGSVLAFPPALRFDRVYYIEVTVNGEVQSPRSQITSAAYAQSARRAELSPIVSAAASTEHMQVPPGQWANYSGAVVQVNCPDSGIVVVQALVHLVTDHGSAGRVHARFALDRGPTGDGGSVVYQSQFTLPPEWPHAGDIRRTIPVMHEFPVGPGPVSFYLNGSQQTLTDTWYEGAKLIATWYPPSN